LNLFNTCFANGVAGSDVKSILEGS
jgi:hypothetical protein